MQVNETTISELQQQLTGQHTAVTDQQVEIANLRQCLADSNSEKSAAQGELASARQEHTAAAQVDGLVWSFCLLFCIHAVAWSEQSPTFL